MPFITYVWDPVQPGDDPAQLIRGVVKRLLEKIESAPWVPSTWMREILNEAGLLRGRMMRRLPLEKVRIVGQTIARAQASGAANPQTRSAVGGLLNYRIGHASYGHASVPGPKSFSDRLPT